VHDLKLACPAYTMMRDGRPCDSCRGGKVHNVLVNKCIKGSAALSAVVMMEAALHRFLRTYESTVARFVVPSRFVLETLVHWGWRRESFVYVPNFVDVERFRPADGVGRRFVYCGRLDNLKGVETLVRAAALARQPVTIVGRGLEEERLGKLAAELRADVDFAGYLTKDALTGVLQSARAIVIPSEVNENAPLSLLEAYATARPVIGSNIAGIPELIRQDETGALFETGNVHALAETLERFARLSDTRIADMGTAGRRWVEQDFNPTTYRDRLLALYASLELVAV
jgi:glycosyltransferase involved in cell wall biosynthesis